MLAGQVVHGAAVSALHAHSHEPQRAGARQLFQLILRTRTAVPASRCLRAHSVASHSLLNPGQMMLACVPGAGGSVLHRVIAGSIAGLLQGTLQLHYLGLRGPALLVGSLDILHGTAASDCNVADRLGREWKHFVAANAALYGAIARHTCAQHTAMRGNRCKKSSGVSLLTCCAASSRVRSCHTCWFRVLSSAASPLLWLGAWVSCCCLICCCKAAERAASAASCSRASCNCIWSCSCSLAAAEVPAQLLPSSGKRLCSHSGQRRGPAAAGLLTLAIGGHWAIKGLVDAGVHLLHSRLLSRYSTILARAGDGA